MASIRRLAHYTKMVFSMFLFFLIENRNQRFHQVYALLVMLPRWAECLYAQVHTLLNGRNRIAIEQHMSDNRRGRQAQLSPLTHRHLHAGRGLVAQERFIDGRRSGVNWSGSRVLHGQRKDPSIYAAPGLSVVLLLHVNVLDQPGSFETKVSAPCPEHSVDLLIFGLTTLVQHQRDEGWKRLYGQTGCLQGTTVGFLKGWCCLKWGPMFELSVKKHPSTPTTKRARPLARGSALRSRNELPKERRQAIL